MATIRKNTKAHAEAVQKMAGLKIYSLNNSFSGSPVAKVDACDMNESKLSLLDGTYKLRLCVISG